MVRKVRLLLPYLLLAATAALAGVRVMDVDAYKNVNGWTPQWGYVTQSFVNTCDTIRWVEFFVGAANDTGANVNYKFDILDEATNDLIYSGLLKATRQHYQYARCTSFTKWASLIKGKSYVLKITHTGGDSINFYYSDQNPYEHGMLISPVPEPAPSFWDLCCRIEGVVYNHPDLLGFWDQIPAHLTDSLWLHYAQGRDSKAAEFEALHSGVDKMVDLGVRNVRVTDAWKFVQPDTCHPDSFNWACGVDSSWKVFASHGIRPHLIAHGSGRWPLCPSFDPWWPKGIYNCMLPSDMFEPIFVESAGKQQVNRDNHLAWFMYNYARRYGPVGKSDLGDTTGTFWSENQGLQRLPLLHAELINEPCYSIDDTWWTEKPFADSIVTRLRTDHGPTQAFCETYARYCIVVNSVLKLVSDSMTTALYCPNDVSNEPIGSYDWMGAMVQCGAAESCDMVSYHSHMDPVEREEQVADAIRQVMNQFEELQDKPLTVGEGSISARYIPAGDTMPSETLRAKNLAETFCAFWARNGGPGKAVLGFDWQSLSAWFVQDKDSIRWGITDSLFGERFPAHAMHQVVNELGGRRFNRETDSIANGDTVRVFEFESDTGTAARRIWVAWKTDNSATDLGVAAIPVRTSYVDVAPLDLTGNQGTPAQVSAGTDGFLAGTFGKSPVFISEPANLAIQRPDLVADSVWTVPSPPVFGQATFLHARVRNRGNAATPANQTVWVVFYSNGDSITCGGLGQSLAAGDSTVISPLSAWYPGSSGMKLLRATANPQKDFVELGWDDNSSYRPYVFQFPQSALDSINPGHPGPMAVSNIPRVILKSVVVDSVHGFADSMRLKSEYYTSASDTVPEVDEVGWAPFDSLRLLGLIRGQGRYRISTRFMLLDSAYVDTSIVLSDSCWLDWTAPSASFRINDSLPFTNSLTCTLQLRGSSDGAAGSGLALSRAGNARLRNLIRKSEFDAFDTSWSQNCVTWTDGPGLCKMTMRADTLLYLYQDIPSDRSPAPDSGSQRISSPARWLPPVRCRSSVAMPRAIPGSRGRVRSARSYSA
jgi:hypothetical protein